MRNQEAAAAGRSVRIKIRKTAKRKAPEELDLRTPSGRKLPY